MTKYNGIDQNTIGYLDLSEVVVSDNLKTNAIPKNLFKIWTIWYDSSKKDDNLWTTPAIPHGTNLN